MATIASPRPQSPASNIRNQSPHVSQSPSLTPSSSVRPSLDLPSSENGAAAAGRRDSSPALAGNPQRRNRAALRDYYNLKAKTNNPLQNLSRTASIASATSESTVTSVTTPTAPNGEFSGSSSNNNSAAEAENLTARLDETKFDADAYVQALLKNEDLRGILRVEGTLVSEIKQLDGERKALVYDNYSKLIIATRTIGEMRREMDEGGKGKGLGLKGMTELKDKVEGVGSVVRELGMEKKPQETDGKLEDKRKRREKKQKEMVRWVVDAPARLEGMRTEGKMEEVTEEWETVKRLLDTWGDVRGVEEVRTACLKAIEGTDSNEPEEG